MTEQGEGLQGLGNIVAASNEFKHHAVNFFYKQLFSRNLALQEADFYAAIARAFGENEYRPKDLIRSLVTSDPYCAR